MSKDKKEEAPAEVPTQQRPSKDPENAKPEASLVPRAAERPSPKDAPFHSGVLVDMADVLKKAGLKEGADKLVLALAQKPELARELADLAIRAKR